MTKPDGFEERVKNDPQCWGLTEAQRERVATLLRQQHKKVRRMVQRTKKMTVGGFRDHILAALDRMAKGGKP